MKDNRYFKIVVSVIIGIVLILCSIYFFADSLIEKYFTERYNYETKKLEDVTDSLDSNNKTITKTLNQKKLERAKLLEVKTDSVMLFLESIKVSIQNSHSSSNKENIHCIEQGKLVKQKLLEYKTFLKNEFKDFGTDSINNYIDTNDGVNYAWEELNFNNLPSAGIATNIALIESNIKTLQSELVERIYKTK